MKRLLLPILSVATALLLTGCFQNETTLELRKDGSGTLTEETSFGPQALEMLAQFAQMGGGKGADPLADITSEAKARERAAGLGEGVVFEKAEVIEKDGWKGGRITYRFADINKLRLSPGNLLKDSVPKMPGAPAPKAVEIAPLAFKYEGDKLSVLIPEPGKPADPPAHGGPDYGAEQEEMMKQMMAGMKVAFRLVIEPGIAETNASFVDGNAITLSEMEFGKIAQQPGALNKIAQLGRTDPAQAVQAMSKFDGVKVEPKRELTVMVK
jgi:hypothetical protein